MPAINRFYNPTQSKYQSQFVPVNLPIDLMAKTLYGKQAKADQMMAAAVKLGEWEQEALGWHDTEYVKGIKNEIQQFATKAMTEDRTSPEFQRQYLDLTNRIKNDENLKKVQGAVDIHSAYQKRHEELTKMGNEAAADALEADYLYRLNEYTKEGGQGFKGLSLGDANIKKGTNIYKDGLEFFSAMKESGGDSVKFLGSGISYKNGWTGISDKRVQDQADRQYNLWKDTDGAKQLRLQELQKLGFVETTFADLPKDEKEKLNNQLDQSLRNEFLDIGRTVIHGKSTTNIDQAYNIQRKEDLEATEAPLFVTTEKTALEKTAGATRDKQIADLKDTEEQLKVLLRKDDKTKILTKENRLAYEQQLASVTQQKNTLQKEHSDAWRQVINKVSGQISKEDLVKFNTGKLASGQFHQLKNVDLSDPVAASKNINANIYNLEAQIKSGSLSSQKMQEAQTALFAQRQMKSISDKYSNRVTNTWRQEFYTKGQGASTMNVEYITASTGDKSMMNSINQAVIANPTGFVIRNSKGDILTGEELKGRVVDFKGGQYSLGNVANADMFGVKGQITYLTEVLDENGDFLRDTNGKIKMTKVTQSVDVIPQGANQQFNKDNIAKEFYQRANSYNNLGDQQQAAAATQVARTYTMSEVYNELRDLQQDQYSPSTIIQVRVPVGNGQSGIANVQVKKVGDVNTGGGYNIIFNGNAATAIEVNSIDQALAEIEDMTK